MRKALTNVQRALVDLYAAMKTVQDKKEDHSSYSYGLVIDRLRSRRNSSGDHQKGSIDAEEQMLTNWTRDGFPIPRQLYNCDTLLLALQHSMPSTSSRCLGCSEDKVDALHKATMNHIAFLLGLPARFVWAGDAASTTSPLALAPRTDGEPSSSPPARVNAAAARDFLWSTASRTANGDQVMLTSQASLIADARANPTQVFLSPPRQDNKHTSDHNGSLGGGGILCSTIRESYTLLMETAKQQAVARGAGRAYAGDSKTRGPSAGNSFVSRLVVYASDQVDGELMESARLAGFAEENIRTIQTVISPRTSNYTLDVSSLKTQMIEDVSHGLFPCLVVGVFGSGLSAASDDVEAVGIFCSKLGVWFHMDARYGVLPLLTAAQCTVGRDAAERFYGGAAYADSIVFGSGAAGPLCALGRGHGGLLSGADPDVSFLYVSHVIKVQTAMRTIQATRHTAANYWQRDQRAWSTSFFCGPHVIKRLALHLAYGPSPTPAPHVIQSSYEILQEIEKGVVATGLWDVGMRGSITFGALYVRLLTHADEVTVSVAHLFQTMLDADGGKRDADPNVLAGVVVLQKRVWLCISLDMDSSTGSLPTASYVVGTLEKACSEVLSTEE